MSPTELHNYWLLFVIANGAASFFAFSIFSAIAQVVVFFSNDNKTPRTFTIWPVFLFFLALDLSIIGIVVTGYKLIHYYL